MLARAFLPLQYNFTDDHRRIIPMKPRSRFYGGPDPGSLILRPSSEPGRCRMMGGWRRWGLLAAAAAAAVAGVWVGRARLEDRVPRKLGVQPDGSILVPTNQLLTPAGPRASGEPD